MSTRSLIFVRVPDSSPKELEGVYCHYDGYPEGVGVALVRHFPSPKAATRLATGHRLRYIDFETGRTDPGNGYYGSFRALEDDLAQTARDMWASYVYIYEPDGWRAFSTSDGALAPVPIPAPEAR